MTGSGLAYRRLRAPRNHGEALIEPDRASLESVVHANARSLTNVSVPDFGDFQDLRQSARQQILRLAIDYTQQYRNVRSDLSSDQRLIVSGHQPELYHPGVWFKNFQLDSIARECEGVALQLIVDNDLCRTNSIRVPSGTIDSVSVRSVAFDQVDEPVPYEQRSLIDLNSFESFPRRCEEAIRSLVPKPFVRELWSHATKFIDQQSNLGLVLSKARHEIERRWGLKTLELPLSQLADSDAFHRFVAWLLLSADKVVSSHNEILAEYRRIHGIRNHAQPIPNLRVAGEMREIPLWIWSDKNPQRRPLWARISDSSIDLSDSASESDSTFYRRIPKRTELLVEALRQLRSDGEKIRPRALITTMFSRLFLCDLFIHGIGGSKYDQLTDELIIRLFALTPPKYATISSTVRLPVGRAPFTQPDTVFFEEQLRRARFHPEQFVVVTNEKVSRLIQRKKSLILNRPPRGERLNWHNEISHVNERLFVFISDICNDLQQKKAGALVAEKNWRILSSREFSFCLHCEEDLRSCLSAPSP